MPYETGPLLLTLKLAVLTAGLLFVLALPLAYWLGSRDTRARRMVKALVNMPLVLPPTVLGFYLLLLFSPSYAPGRLLETGLGLRLVFTFEGLLIGSLVSNLPFMVNPLLSGFEGLAPSLREAAYVLGKSPFTTLLRVLLPNMKPALLSGLVFTFAHTMGEFGVVLMIGGKIPGVTRTAAVAVYDEVESLNFGAANFYAFILCLTSFTVLMALFAVNRRVTPAGR